MNQKIKYGQRRRTKLIVSRSVWVVVGPALAAKLGKGEVMAVLSSHPPRAHSASGHSMPFRSIWLAAMSITLMMNAIAKAQIKLFLTHVCRFFFFGWTEVNQTKRKCQNFRNIKIGFVTCCSGTPDTHLHSPNTCYIFSTQVNEHEFSVNTVLEEAFVPL